ncbi:winged helix DNA-binding domain-containing protein [Rhodococcus sp. WS1]|uniref:winged helix DNA-binding domain-containing protein n=1 Tax=unclassified Rhodococcus (in: high G+C Gram-positive bacteria) TaxID=192944 RepID=UPI001144C55C|nr:MULTISPECIES: winged helix DNA-binding domain-containing protein [unclassified Rhodococcus (in: high G+C Gram-positive bacteria)]ROZ55465.1 winged helix DNA-binding domain-containing protein [Rhodococcus sp. WS1]TQC39757.1 winged helix DNA-binding domain-containing protein [Rhodococcus sp. WS7]
MRHVSDDERRARIGVRHALAPSFRVDSPEAATRAMTVLHATESATVYLSCWARVRSLDATDVDNALYDQRSLVKQLAMRRTLFTFPRDLLPAAWSSASARVANTERARMAKDVVKAGIAVDGNDWLDRARAEVLTLLTDAPEGLSALEVRQAVPMIDVKVEGSAGEIWSAPRVLTHLGATADIMRGNNTARFPVSRPLWTLTRHWLDDAPTDLESADGYREIVRRWLHSFGPGTEDDIVWWLGSTKTVVRAALAELEAVAVSLDSGDTGWLLPDDVATVSDPGPWVALLPVLDPTIMGWKNRDFYLGPHRNQLFDTRGNAGTTAWVDGRVVGCWIQDAAGVVHVRVLESVSADAQRALDAEAVRLTEWLGGVKIGTGYVSQAMKQAVGIAAATP